MRSCFLFSCGQASLLIYLCKKMRKPKALTQCAKALLTCLLYGRVRSWDRQRIKHVLNEFGNKSFAHLKHSADEWQWSEGFEALTAGTDLSPSLSLWGGRNMWNKAAQPSAKCSPFQSWPLARPVAASSRPFILFMHKERVVGKKMQPELHPVPLDIWK